MHSFPPASKASALAAVVLASAPLDAQQFVVDDAPVVDVHACQLEAWHGERASWILPACRPAGPVELSVGMGFVEGAGGDRETEFVAQAKILLRELRPNDVGLSLVAGGGMAPGPQLLPEEFSDLFAYLAATISLADDLVLLHPNAGWFWASGEEDDQHVLTWGIRTDLQVLPRAATIGEVFGENGRTPDWQAGIRLTLIPDRLEADLSYGNSFDRHHPGVGFQAGIAWTPPPFRRSRRGAE